MSRAASDSWATRSPTMLERQLGLLRLGARRVVHDLALQPRRDREPQVFVGEPRRLAPARRAPDEALLHEERLVHVLERASVLAEHDRQRLQADRSAVV